MLFNMKECKNEVQVEPKSVSDVGNEDTKEGGSMFIGQPK